MTLDERMLDAKRKKKVLLWEPSGFSLMKAPMEEAEDDDEAE